MAREVVHRRFLIGIAGMLAMLAVLAGLVLPSLALSPPSGTIITNQAIATYSAANGYLFQPAVSNTISTTVTTAPLLQISASANPDPVAIGGIITYTITLSNTGNSSANATAVSALLPANLQFLSASDGGAVSSGTVSWNAGTIPSGGSVNVTVSAIVKGGVTIPFLATAVASGVAEVSTTLSTKVGISPNLKIVDSTPSGTVSPGGTISYLISYENSGNQTATETVITNKIPLGTALVPGSITGGGTVAGDTISWPIGTLLAGKGGAVAFQVKSSIIAKSGDVISNVSTIYSKETAPVISNQLLVTILSTVPGLTISATTTAATVNPGGTITYTINYGNSGSATASDVIIKNDLPVGTNLVSGSITGGGGIAGSTITWPIGSLPPGASGSVSFTVSVSPAAVSSTNISNQASITSSQTAPLNSNQLLVHVFVPAPVLTVSDTTPVSTVNPGGTITYSINYTNSGSGPASGVIVKNDLPFGTALVPGSISGGGQISGQTISWMIGSLAASAGGTVSFQAAVPFTAADKTVISNLSTIDSNETSVVPSNQLLVTVVSLAPNLTVNASASTATVNPGGAITYTITYGNSGSGPAGTVVVKNDLPSGTTLVPGSITGGGSISGQTISWPVGTLLPATGGTVSFQVMASPTAINGMVISNVSSINSSDAASLLSNPVLVTVNAPSLSIVKTVITDLVRPGNLIRYKITVKNEGQFQAVGVQLRDPVPVGAVFAGADNGGTVQGGTVRWTIAALEVGGTATVQLDLTIDKSFVNSSISNTAHVSANGIAELSSTVEKTIIPRTPGHVDFIDAAVENSRKTSQFAIGDNICVQVTDADRNTDTLLPETVSVTVDHLARGENGAESVDDSVSIILKETGINSGIFQGCFSSSGDAPVTGDAVLSLRTDSTIRATYSDPLDSEPVSNALAFIDPFGVVFDSITGKPVENAVVRLIDDATGLDAVLPQPPLVPAIQANPVITGSNGRFQFQYVAPGSYHFEVKPKSKSSEFTFPSLIADADLPPSYIILPGSRGQSFVLASGMQPLNLDIPVDPPPGDLKLTKTSNKESASIGDLVSYTVTVTNAGKIPVSAVRVEDKMPHGVQYLKNSCTIAGRRSADPQYTGRGMLAWQMAPVAPGESVILTYTATVGPDSQRGDGKNSVRAYGKSAGIDIISNNAVKTIKINGGVFTQDGLIIGRVLIADDDGSGAVKGVPGATLYMEDGTRVVTDGDGKYSISGVRPGTHLIRLDETTLPKGIVPDGGNSRFMGDDSSQFADIAAGGMFKANFGVRKTGELAGGTSGEVLPVAETKALPVPASGQQLSNGAVQHLENSIREMTPDLAILNLSDDMVVQTSRVRLVVKSAPDAVLTVSVNKRLVGPEKVGKKITSRDVVIYEYVNVELEPGEKNRILVEARDPLGRLRESKSVTILTSDIVSRLEIVPAVKEVPADGITTVKILVRLLDRNGTLVSYPENVTVDTSAGEIVEQDADPASPGRQIPCRHGRAEFTVKAPFETVEARISASYNTVEQSEPLFFSPNLRKMMVVGMGEALLGHGRTSGVYSLLKRDTHMERDTYLWGKGAFFVKGELLKGVLLTASFDSDKRKQQDFFRAGNRNVEAEDKYPIYGDESRTGYEALSREKLYVRVDRDRSYLMYGDYETGIGGGRFSAFNRTFTGLKGEMNLDQLKITSFGSYSDQTQVVDNLPGKGISGYYYLNKAALEGTERIVIETRDRQRIDRVLNRVVMSRWSDYTIDYDLGTVLFKAPVPSHDSSLNPVYIIVTYEARTGGSRYFVYGGRGVVRPFKDLELGVTGALEQKAAYDYNLIGADATLKLPGNTTFKAEIAQSDSSFDISNSLMPKNGKAWGVEVESSPIPHLQLSGYYRNISSYFDNPSATDTMRGTRKYGVEGKYGDAALLQLKGRYFNEKDLLNNMDHTRTSAGVEKQYKKSKFGMELIRETSNDRYIPAASSTSRAPFDIAPETAREMTAIRAYAELPLFAAVSTTLSHLQDIQYDRHNLSQIGLNYQLNKTQRLYVREEFAQYEGRKESRTVLGGESQVTGNSVAYEEYRLANGMDGSRSQQSLGLRHKFMLGEKITGNMNIEKLTTLRGNKRVSEPDAFAVAGGIEYLPHANFKITSRLEYRQEFSDNPQNSWLGELNAACRLNQDYTLIFSERYFYNEFKYQGDRITTRTSLGLAYRPLSNDRFNALAKVELKHEENAVHPENTVSDAYIFAMEGVFQASPKLQLTGKYAGKAVVENGFDAYTDLYSARVLYDLTRKIDISGEYRILISHATHSIHQGGLAEIGYRIFKNVWFSGGYSFDRFDADLAGDSYTGEGPYLRMRVKFDENSLSRIHKGR